MGMPRVSGGQVLRSLRNDGNETPVIVLSQHGDTEERALILREGADDYMKKPLPLLDQGPTTFMNKPFGLNELVERMRKLLGRVGMSAHERSLETAQVLVSGALTLDRRTWRAYLGSQEADLKGNALRLLDYLMAHPDVVLTREQLLDKVWGWDYVGGTRTVDTHIRRIRQALRDDVGHPTYIETVRSRGYRFIGLVEAKV
jgi:DNA-binding response OmpR family regulator